MDVEQPECALLELGWLGIQSEPMRKAWRRAHGVAGQRAEMRHKAGESHDAQIVGCRLFGLGELGWRGADDGGGERSVLMAASSVSWNNGGARASRRCHST